MSFVRRRNAAAVCQPSIFCEKGLRAMDGVERIKAEIRRKKMTKKDIAAALGLDEALLTDETRLALSIR